MIRVAIANRQTSLTIDRRRLRRAVRMVLREEGIREAEISVALVDDETIGQLHGRYLGDDEPTDVMSFLLESSPEGIEGEIIASAETACRVARRHRWTGAEESLALRHPRRIAPGRLARRHARPPGRDGEAAAGLLGAAGRVACRLCFSITSWRIGSSVMLKHNLRDCW